jgi:dipeptidyl aminopeptidase/acylaminoacyl peptidase
VYLPRFPVRSRPNVRPPAFLTAVSLHSLRARAGALVAAAVLAGCGDGGSPPVEPPPPPVPLTLASSGRVERGATVSIAITSSGQTVDPAQVALTVTPADAAEPAGAGMLRLLRAGEVQVRATRGDQAGTLTLSVAAPPSVVFDMSVGSNRDIYRVALDGGDLVRLTQAASDERDATAGGGTVVYVTSRHGSGELYSVPRDGGAETRVTNTTRTESAPALSPEGDRLAYASDATGVIKVFTATASNGGAAQAAPGFGFGGSPETSPSWAPTGGRLAFVGTADGTADIYQLTPGGQPQLLAGGAQAEVDPAWSLDGAYVAFTSTREGDPALFMVRVADGVVTRLTDRAGTEAEPTWTRDGRLVYTEFLAGSQTRLVWIDPAAPQTVNVIPVQGGFPRRPSAIP